MRMRSVVLDLVLVLNERRERRDGWVGDEGREWEVKLDIDLVDWVGERSVVMVLMVGGWLIGLN
jgi:hypothetical protein